MPPYAAISSVSTPRWPLSRTGTQTRAKDLQRAYANLRRELTRHHEAEDRWIWPMLAGFGVDRDLLAAMESEHHVHVHGVGGDRCRHGPLRGERVEGGCRRCSRERSPHDGRGGTAPDHEEEELEPVLMPHVESPEWKEVEKKLSRQPPFVAGAFFAWVTDGMSDEGRSFLRSTVPPPVTFILARVFGRRYRRSIAPVWQAGS